jgi:hypothetical protein
MAEQQLHEQQSREQQSRPSCTLPEQQRHPSSSLHAARRSPLVRKRKEQVGRIKERSSSWMDKDGRYTYIPIFFLKRKILIFF